MGSGPKSTPSGRRIFITESSHFLETIFRCSQSTQLLHFLAREPAKLSWRYIERQRPELDPPDFFHVVTYAIEHAPDLPVAPFDEHHFVPRIRGVFGEANRRRRGFDAAAVV